MTSKDRDSGGDTDLQTLPELWSRLHGITCLTFESRSEAGTGWDGTGRGDVRVSELSPNVLTFEESGAWSPRVGIETRFTNTFRWTAGNDSLRLEHLRFGVDNPVLLFDLIPSVHGEWREAESHHCGEDCYSGILKVVGPQIVFTWSVRGPRKQEAIRYLYS
ncbi:DUF6314 family protein [Limnoglobus roseus]|uniref:DUF6314 family protein n=1 Tax=Limnoglobus roseus TaxID=2598579 RepID=UPI0036F35119